MRFAAALAAAATATVVAAPPANAQMFLAEPTESGADVATLADAADAREISDPFEGWNRGVFAINEAIDKALLEPVARAYRFITPRFARTGVRNVLDNLNQPVTFTNDVLQGEPKRAGVSAARFGINSTIGVLGVFDVAKHVGLPDHDEDFGQTLGRWGVDSGPYLVLPLLGPSNVRDAAGRIGNWAIDPTTYINFRDDDVFRATRFGLDVLTARTNALDAVENLRNTSTDPYVTIRSLYALSRASAIRNGRENFEDLPDIEDPMTEDPASLPEIGALDAPQSAEDAPESTALVPEPAGAAPVSKSDTPPAETAKD